MKLLIKIIISLIALINTAWALSVDIEVNPKNPLVEESFELVFNIETDSRESPTIRFDPGMAEVQGRVNKGESISTIFVNGRMSTSRKVSIAYQLIPKRVGQLVIRDINVEVAGVVEKLKNLQLTVLQEAREPRAVFLQAETDKEEYFVGEGIDLKYYIYYRQYVVGQEIKEFPKLNGFIKRFHKNINNSETVQVDGVIYKRTLVYSARMYPEKIGVATVDPMRVNIQYSDMNNQSPFGTFGLQLGRYREQTLSSKPLKLKINAIPAENAPANYTGLVGEHKFELNQAESKFLVNQAIELRLTIEGEGALEKVDAPQIYKHPDLEQFDTRSEVVELGDKLARKQFDYTLLPRGAMNIEPQVLELSTFDPVSLSFITHKIDLTGLQVEGSAGSNPRKEAVTPQTQVTQTQPNAANPARPQLAPLGFLAPTTQPLHFLSLAFWPRTLFYLSSLAMVIILVLTLVKLIHILYPPSAVKLMLKEVERKGATYQSITHLLRQIYPESIGVGSMRDFLGGVKEIGQEEKNFIRQWIEKAERYDYGNRDNKMNKADKANSKKLLSMINKIVKKRQESIRP